MPNDSGKPENGQPAHDAAGFARTVVWLLRTQAVMVVAAAIVAGIFAGKGWALAVLSGGGIGIVLTAVSALRTGAVSASGDPAAMAAAFYRGMLMKMALAVVMFVIVAAMFAAWFLPVIAGYVVTLVAYWIALLRIGRQVGRQADSHRALNDE
ncbi:MAG: ATP synthase subunit I [Wenzhouxiangellaceae bacterium]|nr:ATP synthase subunit I [Wenzhouxiangellaceae bacterium]